MEKPIIEIAICTSTDEHRRLYCQIASELIHPDNVQAWAVYLGETIPSLVNIEAKQSDLFQIIEHRIQKEKERIIAFEEKKRKKQEDIQRRSVLEKPRVNFIPKGLKADYQREYGKYLDQIVRFTPVNSEDYLYQLRYLERWCEKSVPAMLEMERPDAAYAIAIQVCRHIPVFLKKKGLQVYHHKYKSRLRKLILEAFQALVSTVTAWNHEENRREVVEFIQTEATSYSEFRGLGKTLTEMSPLIPFAGEPFKTERELTMEDIAFLQRAERKRLEQERAAKELRSVIPLNPDYEQHIFARRYIDWDLERIYSRMMAEHKTISRLLKEGNYQQAALLYMQLLKSMCRHYVTDEHYTHYDDYYYPGEAADHLTRLFNWYLSESKLPADVVEYLNTAWNEILEEESYTNYGVPSRRWNE